MLLFKFTNVAALAVCLPMRSIHAVHTLCHVNMKLMCRSCADDLAVQGHSCGVAGCHWPIPWFMEQVGYHHSNVCGAHSYHEQRFPLAEEYSYGLCSKGEVHALCS